jgi:CRISPR-associated endonuclease Cas2
MKLSPLQEIFLLLEDEKQVPLFRLNRWGRQAKGVLAKLKRYGWIERSNNDGEAYYKITEKGEREFDRILKPLKRTDKWDNKWRLVIFNIPENKRKIRDQLRRNITKLGMGLLQNSVWISPNDIKDEVEQIKKRLNLENQLRFFEVTRNSAIDKTIIEKAWNLPEIEDDYKQFNFNTVRLLKYISKEINPRYSIKKLIYLYALILNNDPIMPSEFRDREAIRKIAFENYQKLRKFLN